MADRWIWEVMGEWLATEHAAVKVGQRWGDGPKCPPAVYFFRRRTQVAAWHIGGREPQSSGRDFLGEPAGPHRPGEWHWTQPGNERVEALLRARLGLNTEVEE